MPETNRNVVLGLGNILNRDEGLGVYALRELAEQLGPALKAEAIDGGVLGLNLLPIIESCDKLLLLDAVAASQQPGTLIELWNEEIPLYAGVKMSQHQVTFQEVLGLAKMRGHLPTTICLLGIQPEDMKIGLGLSPKIEATMPELQRRAVAVLQNWGLVDNPN